MSEGVVPQLQESIQKAFTDNTGDIGANLLGDWALVAEVHTAEGPVLRIVTGDETPIWRQIGMLKFALNDLSHDVLVYRLVNHDEDE